MSRSLLYPSLALALMAGVAACGSDKPAPAQKKPPAGDGKYDAKQTPPTPAEDGEPPLDSGPVDPFEDTEEWEEDDGFADDDAFDTEGVDAETDAEDGSGAAVDEAGGETEGDEAPSAHLGPCQIAWSSETRVRFNYTGETGGTMKIDADGDKKSDVCAAFTLTDGKPSKVVVDDGCNNKDDLEIVPTYMDDKNLATAKVTDNKAGSDSEITLVVMPSYTGVMPGYPLQAPKKNVSVTARDSLIRTATVKKPAAGPKLKATFFYDKAGRVKTIKEDQEMDGSVDQRYDYRYDASGNVTRVTLTRTGPDGTTEKTIGKLSYACWK